MFRRRRCPFFPKLGQDWKQERKGKKKKEEEKQKPFVGRPKDGVKRLLRTNDIVYALQTIKNKFSSFSSPVTYSAYSIIKTD